MLGQMLSFLPRRISQLKTCTTHPWASNDQSLKQRANLRINDSDGIYDERCPKFSDHEAATDKTGKGRENIVRGGVEG